MSSCCHPNYRPKFFISLLISIFLVLVYFLFQRFFSFSVNASSSFVAFYIFGLLAGLSTCSPVTGSLFLSFLPRRKSALLFILSRLIAFAIFGYFLGVLGNYFRFSIQNIGVISLLVSLVTLVLALNFLKIISFKNFKIKSASPVIAGIITFFLPCGFTLTIQSLALASATPFNSSLIMLIFCLGTVSPLLLIFFSSKNITNNQRFSAYFNQIIGILLLVFSLYSLNSTLSLLNLPSVSFAKNNSQELSGNILKMTASSSGYSPNYFRVKAGQKIRWEITDMGTSGCTNAIIARSLFQGPINLVPGTTSVKKFTAPTTPGTYRFSCWMGMISGVIEVTP
jgi:uncharacterized protein